MYEIVCGNPGHCFLYTCLCFANNNDKLPICYCHSIHPPTSTYSIARIGVRAYVRSRSPLRPVYFGCCQPNQTRPNQTDLVSALFAFHDTTQQSTAGMDSEMERGWLVGWWQCQRGGRATFITHRTCMQRERYRWIMYVLLCDLNIYSGEAQRLNKRGAFSSSGLPHVHNWKSLRLPGFCKSMVRGF